MKHAYLALVLIISVLVLLANSSDPPNGKTGAPGDSLCTECHGSPSQTIKGIVTLEGFPAAITPNQVYPLTVVVRDTSGNAVKAGFQMTILGPSNTRAGTMATPSPNSALINASGRQYFEHRPAVTFPDSNVIRWTVNWMAPDLAAGSQVTYFLATNLANGNFKETGDKIITATGHGNIVLSASGEIAAVQPVLYPNPGTAHLNIRITNSERPNGKIYFFNTAGIQAGEADVTDGSVDVPALVPGVYWTRIQMGDQTYFSQWIKM